MAYIERYWFLYREIPSHIDMLLTVKKDKHKEIGYRGRMPENSIFIKKYRSE